MERIMNAKMNSTGVREAMQMMPQNKMGHMTFFWGKSSEILFSGWPGDNTKMYILALVFIFLLSMLIEWISHARLIKPGMNRIAAGLLTTFMYAVRIGLAYLVMLAVMSFNAGILLAAVAGYTAGFVVFGGQIFKDFERMNSQKISDLPPLNC